MVGYNNISKAYRLLDPKSKKIVISRNIIFDEKVFPLRTNNIPAPEPTFDTDVSNSLFQSSSGPTSPEGGSREEGLGINERNRDHSFQPEQLPNTNKQPQANKTPSPVPGSHIPIAFS
jgi:hypothetical protein